MMTAKTARAESKTAGIGTGAEAERGTGIAGGITSIEVEIEIIFVIQRETTTEIGIATDTTNIAGKMLSLTWTHDFASLGDHWPVRAVNFGDDSCALFVFVSHCSQSTKISWLNEFVYVLVEFKWFTNWNSPD